MIINHNMASLNTYRQLSTNNANSAKSLEKLSSGLRINKAGDDAAGLAISEKMRGQIRGLDQAARNSQDAISMIQTAEGSLSETHSILQRMRELAVQGGNDTNTSTDRGEIQKELNSLTSEINRIGNTTEFNSQKLLNATSGTTTAAVTAVAGDYKAVLSAPFSVGETVTIDGEVFTAASGSSSATTFDMTDATTQATTLAAAINGNAILSAKYTATVSGADVQLVQKAGQESATGPVVSDTGATANATASTTTAGVAGVEAKSSFSMQIGANESQTMTLDFADMRSLALGITGTAAATGFTATNTVTDGTNDTANEAALDVSTSANAGNAVTVIQAALEKVSAERSKLGANSNRLEHTITNLGTSSENMTAAESRIRDVDMAKEMMNFQKNNILSQAATAMLAQANQAPQGVLQLLR
ncbi:flagellin [Desulfosporosinus sp. BICA1-9]|uniref:flagellin N-terminal helical domain-containing protein n=1 Tax=Desulfosporosinus sp. BICA1-9 TaxID=1531958 RepID=UPI00054B78DB|nr:flagellin [Desulfosporosinus sp. BICA1-9]KJS49585.1 MAG: flagellin [Peptococcaceae bacterium BRH_c23]KJS90040.1 MAG: flagellin [Desulfosporosinus sp. BICA1-9]HBW36448.1 flagellin [Desulfosporosinus sp.]